MFHQTVNATNVIKKKHHKVEFFILKLISFVVVWSLEKLSLIFVGHFSGKDFEWLLNIL